MQRNNERHAHTLQGREAAGRNTPCPNNHESASTCVAVPFAALAYIVACAPFHGVGPDPVLAACLWQRLRAIALLEHPGAVPVQRQSSGTAVEFRDSGRVQGQR
jgi:hypothetical protein